MYAGKQANDVQLLPQSQLEAPEQPQSPAIVVNGGLVVIGWKVVACSGCRFAWILEILREKIVVW